MARPSSRKSSETVFGPHALESGHLEKRDRELGQEGVMHGDAAGLHEFADARGQVLADPRHGEQTREVESGDAVR